ncbi:MAG TPA: tetratricopeptide repeat protein [Polyangiaceae bacterium]|nr:tetratricopeptide repeat protein [Polyangiaceae bacterium]
MDAEKIRGALGRLQQDADSQQAWDSLRELMTGVATDEHPELARVLALARKAHAQRGEWDAVAELMSIELGAADENDQRVALLMELGRVRQQELLDEPGAMAVYAQVLEIAPGDEIAEAAIAENAQRAGNWREMAAEYLREANTAADSAYRAAMLMRGAETEWRFAGDDANSEHVLTLLVQASEADSKNQDILRMLERLYRRSDDLSGLKSTLERWARNGDEASARVAAALRLAHLQRYRLNDEAAAIAAYEMVLTIVTNQTEALEALVEYYSRQENWDKLVQLYERELAHLDLSRPERVGEMLQIAMLHWRKRNSLTDAAMWFDRIRVLEPTSGAMLEFYREYSTQIGDEALLLKVLQGAQRVLPEGKDKQAITQEIARLAESQEDAQKAIEQYKALLRQSPGHTEAREALKSLYRKTQGYNQLVDVLRHELEAVAEGKTQDRLRLLREVAAVYREHIPSDTSLVSALNQILQVDDKDVEAVRELIALYERLGRWRDLIASQQRLAELTSDAAERVSLLRAAGNRWLTQFSNVQNATSAFESLLALAPEDREARETLADLYKKRRAWPQLFGLYEKQVATLQGPERLALMKEMASLAAERLGQADVAARLYRDILQAEPSNAQVLDALQKHAERSKDWATLAWALELQSQTEREPNALVQVLQKLGAVYTEHLHDGEKAAGAWRRVLNAQPNNPRAIRVLRDAYLERGDYGALEELYAVQGDFEGLAEVLSNAADKATNIRQRIDLSYRAAATYEDKLKQPERAFRSYERILQADPMDTKAARALVPLYERDEKWARLTPLYELLVAEADTPERRFELYSRLYYVAAQRLNDRAGAVVFAQKAYAADPERPDALGLFHRACDDAGQWQPYINTLLAEIGQRSGAPKSSADNGAKTAKKGGKKKGKGKGEQSAANNEVPSAGMDAQTRRLELSLADVYEHKLNQPAEAALAFKRVLQGCPEESEVASKLDALLRRLGDRDSLRWLFDFRVDNAASNETKIQVLHTAAAWEEQAGETARAAELYARVLELDPADAPAVQKLPKLLLSIGDAKRAAEVIERHKGSVSPGLCAELEVDLAGIYLDRLEQPELALTAALAGLEGLKETVESVGVQGAVEVLQRLVEIDSTRRKAAEALAEVYKGAAESRREADALSVLIDMEKQPARRLELLRRTMAVYQRLDSHGRAFELALRACREFPEELELWDTAGSLSGLSGRPTELADVYREVLRRTDLSKSIRRTLCEHAALLHEEQLGDPVGATPYLEQVLMDDPSDTGAFAKLKQILTSAERWDELRSLYDQTIVVLTDSNAKIEALAEVAMVCEEFMDDPKAATGYFEQIRALNPDSELALEALDRLWSASERTQDLASLLEHRLQLAHGDAVNEFRLRLAHLYLDRLHQPEAAFRYVEDVLGDEVNHVKGRELAERLLQIKALRIKASVVLERVYEARDDVRDWVRVLEVRAQALRDPEVDEASTEEHPMEPLLRQIAELYNHRLRDDEGALRTLLELVPRDPGYAEGRTELLEIAGRAGAEVRIAEALEAAANAADILSLKGEILMQAAALYEGPLRNAERAEVLFHKAMNLDPADPELVLPAARALERLQTQSASHAALVSTLKVRLRLEQDIDERSNLWQRIAALSEERLSDDAGAVEAWRSRLSENPDDPASLAALDRLLERQRQWADLVQVLEARVRIAESDDERRQFMHRMAVVHAERLARPDAAIEVYRRMQDDFGPDRETAGALAKLYDAAARWDDLADIYDTLLGLNQSEHERLDLLLAIGDLRRTHLSNSGGALEAYREITTLEPNHAGARAALEAMLASEDSLNRREAAEILQPLYEAARDDVRLLGVLRTLVEVQDDPTSRVDVLAQAVRVAADRLGDKNTALNLAVRALRDGVGHVDLRPWLQELERLASQTGERRLQVQVLSEIVAGMFDADAQFEVVMQIATIARDELSDRNLALAYFNKALEIQPESDAALAALEKLYDEGKQHPELLNVLERRAEIAPSDRERKELLLWRGRLLDEQLSQPEQAIRVYESILDIDLDPRAVAALGTLYTREKHWQRAIELHQRQLDAGDSAKAEHHVAMAQIWVRELHDAGRAFDELEAALDAQPQAPSAIVELERLMSAGEDIEQHARAATILEPIYLARADYDRVMATITARLPGAAVEERRELLQQLAQLYEEQKEDYRAALETVARILHDDLSDRGTVQELERLAKVADCRSRLVEIYATELGQVDHEDEASASLCRRTGELYRELGDSEKALTFFRRALKFDPESVELFDAIDGLLKAEQRHGDRVDLYRAALDHRFDPEDRLRLLHTVGNLQNEHLGRFTEAIETYVQALEIHPDDPVALDTLSRLYYSTQRFEDLYDLVLKRAEGARDPRNALAFRLALAKLCRHELKDSSRAVDQLEEIVRVDPRNVEAIAELESLRKEGLERQRTVEILSPLYEAADDWRHLIKLNEDRFDLAPDLVDKVNVLRQTAVLWEQRGRDANRALQALVAAIQLDPDDDAVRAEFERLVELTSSWNRLAEVYTEILARPEPLTSARDVWLKLAQVHDGPRDDPRAALSAYRQVHELDASEIEPVERMEALATLLSDWETLDWVLVAKADLVLDDEERASTWRRIGEGRRDMLARPAQAIAAYEKALEFEPDSAFTIDCLIDLYETHKNPARLVELYRRRVEVADPDDVDLSFGLLVAAANCYEKEFSDRHQAIEMLVQALERKPNEPTTLASLHRLYTREERWPELLDILRAQAETAEDPQARIRARREMGDTLVAKLESFEDALDAYALVLTEVPSDEEARVRVQRLGEQHEELRGRVAEILIPALVSVGAHLQHVEVLELRLTVESDPLDRAATLRASAEVLQDKLNDADGAKKALLRALSEVPDDDSLHTRIADLCQSTSDWSGYADALNEKAHNTFDAEIAKDLFARLGRIAESRLSDPGRAIEAYRRAVEQVGDQPDLLLALDRLYSDTKNWTEFVDVLERRIPLADSDHDRADLYCRLAEVQLDEFGETGQGLGSLRSALDLVPDHARATAKLEGLTENRDLFGEVSEILEGVYRARGVLDKLGALFAQRVAHAETPGERIELQRKLAQLLESELGDPGGAQKVIEAGIVADPGDSDLLHELERLATTSGRWQSAAQALETALEKHPDLDVGTAKELCVKAADWYSGRLSEPARAEASLTRALQFDPAAEDVLLQLEQLQAAQGKTAARAETLRLRARLQFDESSKEHLYQEAIGLLRQTGANARVEEMLREILVQDNGNLWALRELVALTSARGDAKETFDLIGRLLHVAVEAEEIARLRHQAADLAKGPLAAPEQAIEFLEQAFSDDPLDARAASELRELLRKLGRDKALAQLIERVIDVSDEPRTRATLRLELAELQKTKFKQIDQAIETLRHAIEEDPSCSDAVVLLSQLYEEQGKDEELAELLSEQIAAARNRGDTPAELSLEVRLAEVYETKLNDVARASETHQRVLSRDPNHTGALKALVRLSRKTNDSKHVLDYLARLWQLASGAEKIAVGMELHAEQVTQGQTELAVTTLEQLTELVPGDAALRQKLRDSYRQLKSWEKLANLIASEARQQSDSKQRAMALAEAARIFTNQLGDASRAVGLLEEATAAEPGERTLLLELCDAYSACGRANDAISALERIVESFGGRRSKELAEIHRRLANAFQAQGQLDKAAAELDRAFRIEPGNLAVLKALGQLSLELNDLPRAQQMYRALLLQKLEAGGPITKSEVFYALAVIHQRLGENPKAIQMLERALQAEPGMADAQRLMSELKR